MCAYNHGARRSGGSTVGSSATGCAGISFFGWAGRAGGRSGAGERAEGWARASSAARAAIEATTMVLFDWTTILFGDAIGAEEASRMWSGRRAADERLGGSASGTAAGATGARDGMFLRRRSMLEVGLVGASKLSGVSFGLF